MFVSSENLRGMKKIKIKINSQLTKRKVHTQISESPFNPSVCLSLKIEASRNIYSHTNRSKYMLSQLTKSLFISLIFAALPRVLATTDLSDDTFHFSFLFVLFGSLRSVWYILLCLIGLVVLVF